MIDRFLKWMAGDHVAWLESRVRAQSDEIQQLRTDVARMQSAASEAAELIRTASAEIDRLRYSDSAQRALIASLRDVNKHLDERVVEAGA